MTNVVQKPVEQRAIFSEKKVLTTKEEPKLLFREAHSPSTPNGEPPKYTFIYWTVQAYDDSNRHYLVATPNSNKTNYCGIRTGDPYGDTDTDYICRPHEVQSSDDAFSYRLTPVSFSERLALGDVRPSSEVTSSYGSYVDHRLARRFHEQLHLGPRLKTIAYQDGLVCYTNSNRRKFHSETELEPRHKPMRYSETLYLLPKNPEKTFVSACGQQRPEGRSRKWFTTAVELVPITYSSNSVHNFKLKTQQELNELNSLEDVGTVDVSTEDEEMSDEDVDVFISHDKSEAAMVDSLTRRTMPVSTVVENGQLNGNENGSNA